jgi:hypothetical protein
MVLMFCQNSPELAGVIRVQIDHLRNRKVMIDQLIEAMERYSVSVPYARDPGAMPPMRARPSNTESVAGAGDCPH